jgi:hypothetical protein
VIVNSWDLKTLDLKPRLREILSSSDAARAIALNLAAARASQTTRCTSARGLSCSTGRSRWRPRRGTHDRRRWAAGGVRARRAPRGDRDRRCAAAAAPDPMAGQRASWRDDHPRSTPAATPPSRHSDLNPLGSGPRGGPTLGQAGPLGLTAQARLTQRIRGRRQIALKVELDRLAIWLRALADAVGPWRAARLHARARRRIQHRRGY